MPSKRTTPLPSYISAPKGHPGEANAARSLHPIPDVPYLDPGDETLGNWLALYIAVVERCQDDLRLPARVGKKGSSGCYPTPLDQESAAAALAAWQEAARS
jgi:hypothetical protein